MVTDVDKMEYTISLLQKVRKVYSKKLIADEIESGQDSSPGSHRRGINNLWRQLNFSKHKSSHISLSYLIGLQNK